MKLPRTPEKAVQQQILVLLRSVGASTYTIGTSRRRGNRCPSCATFVPEGQGTHQTPGIPDIVAFVPNHPGALTRREVWIEVKAHGGKLRAEQEEFQDACRSAQVAHIVGGLDEVIAWLMSFGLLKADQVAHYRQPKEHTP